jgi:hypothetical protein
MLLGETQKKKKKKIKEKNLLFRDPRLPFPHKLAMAPATIRRV